MDPSSPTAPTAVSERRIAAEVISLLQGDLDRAWALKDLAAATAHGEARIAEALWNVLALDVGGARRRLQAERDGVMRGVVRLASERAPRARAVPEAEAPHGLSGPPDLERFGPLHGWVVELPSVGPVAITRALWSLVRRGEPVAPYTMGVSTEAWGRGREGSVLRCVRLMPTATPPGGGAAAWSHPAAWFASFRYQGSVTGLNDACTWMAASWVPSAELRLAYGSLFALVEGVPDWRGRVTATLHLPVLELEA